jgi:DNA-binding PadR family transcriptional regulator
MPRPDARDAADFQSLHALELRILLVATDGPAHGYRIVKAIEEIEGGRLTLYPANLYRRIRDLTARGLLVEAPPPPGEETGARPRTYFAITPLGREVVRAEVVRLEELVRHARKAMSTG